MNVRHFDIKTPEVEAPSKNGWEQLPLGYYWKTRCQSNKFRSHIENLYSEMRERGIMGGGRFQLDCLLSILSDIQRDQVNIFELGAGWGRLCLNLAGAIDFKVIPCAPKRYHCLAVEAEPTHYQWLREHFEEQNVNGTAIFGAVSNKNGNCFFDANSSNPSSQYGQAISPLVGRRGIPNIHSLRKVVAGRTIKVPMYTLDRLVQEYGFGSVDIVQMDVQGAEYNVIQGAVDCIKENIIDYFLINIHSEGYNSMIYSLLRDKYNLIIDLERASTGTIEGFPPIQCHDGIQLYKRKDCSK